MTCCQAFRACERCRLSYRDAYVIIAWHVSRLPSQPRQHRRRHSSTTTNPPPIAHRHHHHHPSLSNADRPTARCHCHLTVIPRGCTSLIAWNAATRVPDAHKQAIFPASSIKAHGVYRRAPFAGRSGVCRSSSVCVSGTPTAFWAASGREPHCSAASSHAFSPSSRIIILSLVEARSEGCSRQKAWVGGHRALIVCGNLLFSPARLLTLLVHSFII